VIRVSVKNFQSIAQSSVEIDGLTIVTGPNNSGKTALMRAIRGVFTNAKGNNFVRHGTDACEVTVEFADGNVVTWEKGKSLNRYTVNGKLLDKVGQGVPDEVEAMGVYPITSANQILWPQIAPQFTGQVFLLDQPGSVLAEAVSDVERVGKLSRALKACESDKRQVASELRVRRADQKSATAEMATFDGLDKALTEVEAIDQAQKELAALRAEIEELEDIRSRREAHKASVAALNGAEIINVPALSVTASLTADAQHLKELCQLRDRLTASQKGYEQYEGADALACPEVPSQSVRTELAELVKLRQQLQQAQASVSKLGSFSAPSLDPAKADKIAKAVTVLMALGEQKSEHQKTFDALRQEETTAKNELLAVEVSIREILEQLPACPTCGSSHAGCV